MPGAVERGAQDAALALQTLVGAGNVVGRPGGPKSMIPYAAPRAHPPSCMGNMEQDWLPTAVMPSSAMPGNDLPGAEAEKRKIR